MGSWSAVFSAVLGWFRFGFSVGDSMNPGHAAAPGAHGGDQELEDLHHQQQRQEDLHQVQRVRFNARRQGDHDNHEGNFKVTSSPPPHTIPLLTTSLHHPYTILTPSTSSSPPLVPLPSLLHLLLPTSPIHLLLTPRLFTFPSFPHNLPALITPLLHLITSSSSHLLLTFFSFWLCLLSSLYPPLLISPGIML